MSGIRSILFRYGLATLGLFFVALGVALSLISNLGTSPLSAPACVLSATGTMTVGEWTVIVNTILMLLQLALLRKNFKLKFLMQIPATVVFGALIDLCIFGLGWLEAATMAERIALSLFACLSTAFGVSLEVVSKGWMLSAEMTVSAFSSTFDKPFDKVKVAMDSLMLVLAAVLSLVLFSNPFGSGIFEGLASVLTGDSEGVVIGLGTLLLALLAGGLMKITDPLVNSLLEFVPGCKFKSKDC